MSLAEADRSLFFFINLGLQNTVFDSVMPLVTSNAFLLFLPLFLLLALKERKRAVHAMIAGLLAVAFADACSHTLKEIFMRQRPCTALDNVHLLVGCGRSFSMPSNHASNSFAMAMSVWFMARGRLTPLFIAAAVLVSFSRIYVGVHYPSDVLAGAAVGAASAYASVRLFRWAERIREEHSYTKALFLLLILISFFRLSYIMTGPFDLSADEAHYWEWSRRPDWSYYSKGPMIAWLIRLGTTLFGDTVTGIRSFAVLLSALSSLLLFRLGRDMYDERTGFASAVLLQIVPLFSVFGMLLTIDSPFIFFWALCLYLFFRTVRNDPAGSGSRLLSWAALGISAGLGLLTKYTMVFFIFSAFLYLVFQKDDRRLLKTPGPYLALVLAVITFSPVIFWNASNGWVTIKHTAGQAHIREGLVISFRSLGEFLGSQLGVMTPALFVMAAFSAWKLKASKEGSFLFWFSMPVIIFFVVKSIQGKVQANWAMTGYLTWLVAFAAYFLRPWEGLKRPVRVATASAIILSLLITAVAHAPSLLRLPEDLDPSMRLAGWKELGEEADVLFEDLTAKGPAFVFSESYQTASELAFYMKGHPVTYCANLGRRMNQYDLWPGFENLKGQNALFIRTKERKKLPKEVIAAFSRCDQQVITVKTRKKKTMKFTSAACYDFKGFESQQPESF